MHTHHIAAAPSPAAVYLIHRKDRSRFKVGWALDPVARAQGLPEFQAVGWNALFAPKGTPKEIVDRLNTVARAALKDDNRTSTSAGLGRFSSGLVVAELAVSCGLLLAAGACEGSMLPPGSFLQRIETGRGASAAPLEQGDGPAHGKPGAP